MATDPFAPPEADIHGVRTAVDDELGPVVFDVPTPAGFKWTTSFHESHVRITKVDGEQSYTYARNKLPEVASLVFMPGGGVGISFPADKKIVVNVPKDRTQQLRTWIDPIATDLMQAPLKKGRAARGIFGVLCFMFLLVDFSVFWIALGGWNAGMFAASFIKPHRVIFLFQAIFSFGLFGFFAFEVYRGRSPWWVAIIALFILLGALSAYRLYGFFGMRA